MDMSEASPPKPEERPEGGRAVATGGLRRVFNARMARESRSRSIPRQYRDEDDDDEGSDDGERELTPLTQNTSNHYTLNMPAPIPPQSDTPYILLG